MTIPVLRCGARTRAGHRCRQPAMRKGRCRLHGGKSTGPKTPAGRDRIRRVHLKHGRNTANAITERRRNPKLIQELRELTAVLHFL